MDAYEFYADPKNQAPEGPARKRHGKALSAHVPVRFAPETIAAIKAIAQSEGLSVSTWIRLVISRELERRQPPKTESAVVIPFQPTIQGSHEAGPWTTSSSEHIAATV